MQAKLKTRLALPGKGALEAATLAFFAECGMKVNRNNPRQYLAHIRSIPELEVVFQRAADIPALVQNGDAALGVTGYDILAEHRGILDDERDGDAGDDDLLVLERDLDYGNCRLVVAVPETWIDVNNCADLWHLVGYYRSHNGRGLRIATKYPLLTGQFLRTRGITHCKIISPHGALEAAPLTDTADLIVDLTESGTTLRENHLKLLDDGVVLHSQACLIANSRLLRQHAQALRVAFVLLELIEARMQARNRSLITAYMQSAPQGNGEASDIDTIRRACTALSQRLSSLISGFEFQIPAAETRASSDPYRFIVSGVMNTAGSATELLETVALLRDAGATHINITPLTYRFSTESTRAQALQERLKRLQ